MMTAEDFSLELREQILARVQQLAATSTPMPKESTKNDQESSEKNSARLDLWQGGIISTTEIRNLQRLKRDLEALLSETPECRDIRIGNWNYALNIHNTLKVHVDEICSR